MTVVIIREFEWPQQSAAKHKMRPQINEWWKRDKATRHANSW